ncbi:DMT family transporter [Flexithrix dorotheae]|uniref:DMT family transporter n=1 Tax=Flexithrix dorotheae TaxID=70993 RepID=UPI0003695974|nr:DMT family transporter [Flexithrix dorotheae]
MKTLILQILAFSGGVFLAIQAGFNTQLSGHLKQPVLAAISTSVFSVAFASLFIIITGKQIPNMHEARLIPWYLWGIGGLFSVLGISLYFYTIPRLGISKMIAMGLCGQLIFSMVAGNFGWLNLPVEPLTSKKLLGTFAMILGIILINN